jgi:hypothetical protein
MLDTSPARWANLRARVAEMQAAAPAGVAYKVLFLGRHGQGWHNFAAAKYGHQVRWGRRCDGNRGGEAADVSGRWPRSAGRGMWHCPAGC